MTVFPVGEPFFVLVVAVLVAVDVAGGGDAAVLLVIFVVKVVGVLCVLVVPSLSAV